MDGDCEDTRYEFGEQTDDIGGDLLNELAGEMLGNTTDGATDSGVDFNRAEFDRTGTPETPSLKPVGDLPDNGLGRQEHLCSLTFNSEPVRP